MYIFAGCNGSGKSTLIEQFGGVFGNVINPDAIAKKINPLDPRKADLTAGKAAIRQIENAFISRETFCLETTLSGQYIMRQMIRAKDAGYKVLLYYIGLQDVQMHIDRVRTRVLEGGHYIAPEDIIRRNELSLGNLNAAIKIADATVILDNSDEEFQILVEIENGKIQFHSFILPQWLKGIEHGRP